MKGLNSIKEWAIRLFALIIKTVAPTMAVKFFTVWFPEGQSWYRADSKEKVRLFLPGAAKEVKAIQKLNLTEAQLRRHVWSDGTCEELLRQGDTSLWYLAKTEEAYNLIVATGDAKVIAEVFKTNTPSVAYLKNWLKTADEKLVLTVIAEAPSIFNDVKFNDIKRKYANALVSSSDSYVAERWSEKAFKVLVDCYLHSKSSTEERELFDKAMGILVETDYDFTKFLEKMSSHHWDWYEKVRAKAGQSGHAQAKHLVSYLAERIPRVWFLAKFRELESDKELMSFGESYRGENWPRVMDARQWLKLAYENISKPEVIKVCLDHITDLKYGNPCGAIAEMQEALVAGVKGYQLIKLALTKLPEQYAWQLKSKLYGAISSYAEARECMHGSSKEEIVRIKAFPKSYRKGLRAKLVEMTCKSDAAELIRTYWPFTNWEAENAEKAVRRLAQLKALPLDKLGELSEELKQAALDEVDFVSETAVLLADRSETSTPGQTEQKLLSRRLHPRSEAILFTRGYHWQKAKLQYISKFKMSEAGFKAMVNHCGNYGEDEERGYALVRAHAEKWGLTEGEYLALTQSPYYSDLAAPFRCCQNETRQPSFEDGV